MMDRRLRFAVLMDYTFSSYQEEIRVGTDRYFAEADIDSVYFSLGNLDQSNADSHIREILFGLITPAEFDGIILVGSSMINVAGVQTLRSRLERLRDIPLVSVGPSIFDEETVLIDNDAGIRKVMAHLIEDHGYRRFAYVSGPALNPEAEIRLAAFRSCLDEAGIAHSSIDEFEGTFMSPSGAAAVTAFLDERGLDPEAIVCANDNMVIGVLEALRARGLSVPGDIAVTGFDDFQVSQPLSLQFTTVRLPFDEQGYVAAKVLHRQTQGLSGGVWPPLMPMLRIRGSCGCLSFSDRKADGDSVRESAGLADLERSFSPLCAGDGHALSEVRAVWAEAARKALSGKTSFHALESLLRNIGNPGGNDSGNGRMETLLMSDLHAILLETGIQQDVMERMRYQTIMDDIRVAIDRFEQALSKTLSPAACTAHFAAIADCCRTRSLYLVAFDDERRPLDGGSVLYAPASPGMPEWKPGPGNWFPRGEHSVAVNLLSHEDNYIGYFLLDTHIPVNPYEYIHIRFSNILWELSIMRNMRELNLEMSREIAARKESEEKLKDALVRLEQTSIEDELTHLYNRRGFLTLAEQQVKYLRRQNDCYFILFTDLDGLKGINDRWGHQEGDVAIRTAARILRSALRDSDIVGRLGGDEFTALINKALPPSFEAIKERIRYICDRENAELARPWKVSMSIGHFCAEPGCTLSVKEMLERADAELYEQKQLKKGC